MAFTWKGLLPFGNAEAREVSKRVGGVFADTAALKALPVRQRADGMVAVVKPAQLWVFDASSSAGASATVLVPDAGTGRWLAGTFAA